MGEPITIFRASSGLNVKVDPARIRFDPETGVTDLAVAVNVDHDQTGRISRRKGYNDTAITANCHSLFCEGGDALMVTGTSLYLVAPDLSSYRAIATVTAGARVSYAQVAGTIYWTNRFEKGVVSNGVNTPWVKGTYYGPSSNRVLSDPPAGSLIAYSKGHMFVADGSTLFFSDPYSLNAFDLARGFFQFEDDITMIRPVDGGVFVGTEFSTHFLSGPGPTKFRFTTLSGSSVIRGTDVPVDLSHLGYADYTQTRTGEAAMWTGSEGIFLGTGDGQAFNLTKDKLFEQAAIEGAAQIINGRYVVSLAP